MHHLAILQSSHAAEPWAGEYAQFSARPPAWEVAHRTSIAWVLDKQRSQLLLVRHRLHGWSCPGGHVEPGESAAEAAVRELAEETGIHAQPSARLTPMKTVGCARFASAIHWTVGFVFVLPSSSGTVALRPEGGQPAGWFPLDRLPSPRPSDIDHVAPLLMPLLGNGID